MGYVGVLEHSMLKRRAIAHFYLASGECRWCPVVLLDGNRRTVVNCWVKQLKSIAEDNLKSRMKMKVVRVGTDFMSKGSHLS